MPTFDQHRADWELLGEDDPLWAVLSSPATRGNRWDVDAFFATGVTEIDRTIARLEHFGWVASGDVSTAADFGCGVGRLSRALASHFSSVVGIDVSAQMVARAEELNPDVVGVTFVTNPRPDLSAWADQTFELVHTSIVLQHLPDADTIAGYVAEFCRVLQPGGALVFDVPTRVGWFNRLWLRRRAYRVLRRLGVSHRMLHERLQLSPMTMMAVSSPVVENVLTDGGCLVLGVDVAEVSGMEKSVFYAAKPS